MKRATYIVLFGLLAAIATSRIVQAEVLTNDMVVTMVKAGLGEELIISKIKSSHTEFDLSVDGLPKLKGAGISQKIIAAMLDTNRKDGQGNKSPQKAAGRCRSNQ